MKIDLTLFNAHSWFDLTQTNTATFHRNKCLSVQYATFLQQNVIGSILIHIFCIIIIIIIKYSVL